MLRIYKYPLSRCATQTIEAAIFRPLKVDIQNDTITLWAMIDDSLPKQEIEIFLIGTGHPLPDEFRDHIFLGTVKDGVFVWHIFMPRLDWW